MQTSKLSLFDAILMNMNIMIGGGVFVGPAMMALAAGNASFLAWPIAALIFLPLVLSIAQVMKLFPQGGGMFQYMQSGLGKQKGFIGSWIYLTGYTFVSAIMLLCLYNAVLSSFGPTFLTTSRQLFYILILFIVFIILLQPVSRIGRIQSSCTIIKLIPIIALIGLFVFQINPEFTITSAEFGQLPQAVVPWALFGFLGFEACCGVVHLIDNGEKNGLRALLIGFFGVVTLYTLFHFGLLHVMGAANLATYTASAFSKYILAPQPVIRGLDLLILGSMTITFFASLLGLVFGNASFFSLLLEKKMIKQGNLLEGNNLHQRPVKLIAAQILVVLSILMASRNLDLFASYANLCLFSSLLFVFASLIIQNKQRKAWGSLIINILASIITTGIILYSMFTMAPTMYERSLALLPLVPFIGFGFWAYQNQE